jgi:outer membrane protein assembly factor BamB
LLFANTWNIARIQKLAAPQPAIRGGTSTGVVARVPAVKPGEVVGHFAAINPLTGEKKWEIPLTDLPSAAGMLATGGGLVFHAAGHKFIAFDAATGKPLWTYDTGAAAIAPASTYAIDGEQYVALMVGFGGAGGMGGAMGGAGGN